MKPAGSPAARAAASISRPNCGLAAKPTSSGTAAARQRARSAHQDSGRYTRRSISARPLVEAYARSRSLRWS
jgi:hypothetical protein